jgi:hypothetical protein
MRMMKALAIAALGLAAANAHAVNWHAMKMNKAAILSIDQDSIKKSGDETEFRYMVDYRVPQGEESATSTRYRSVITYAKFRCKAKTISMGRSEAYAALGGQGTPVARNRPTAAEVAFKPLEKDSSDQDLFGFVCEGKGVPKADAPKAPAKLEVKK